MEIRRKNHKIINTLFEEKLHLKEVSKIEHPAISRTLRTGYPVNVEAESEDCGTDYFGEKIVEGEDIIQDGSDTILKHNLERYLSEVYGMTFQTIK